jgi:hypothetical protein
MNLFGTLASQKLALQIPSQSINEQHQANPSMSNNQQQQPTSLKEDFG